MAKPSSAVSVWSGSRILRDIHALTSNGTFPFACICHVAFHNRYLVLLLLGGMQRAVPDERLEIRQR